MAINYANSWVEICNRALGRLGKGRISDLISGGDLVEYCNLYLGEAIEYILSLKHWTVLVERVQLAVSSTTPVYGYDYSYPFPADLISLKKPECDEEEYSIEGNAILTNATEVYITYIKRPADPTTLPGYIKKAISTYLAFLLTTPLTASDQLRGLLAAEMTASLEDAIRADGKREYQEADETWFEDER